MIYGTRSGRSGQLCISWLTRLRAGPPSTTERTVVLT